MPAPATMDQARASKMDAATPGTSSQLGSADQLSKSQMKKALKKGWWARRRNGSGTESGQQQTQRTGQFQQTNANDARKVTFQFNSKAKGKGAKGGKGKQR